jgi:hypothetical protein
MDYAQGLEDLRFLEDEEPSPVLRLVEEPLVIRYSNVIQLEAWSVQDAADAVAAVAMANAVRLERMAVGYDAPIGPDFPLVEVPSITRYAGRSSFGRRLARVGSLAD